MNPARFLDLPEEYTGPDSPAVVIPVPLERTVTYGGGTERGPEAILAASAQVEIHEPLAGIQAARAGIRTGKPVDCDGPLEDVVERVRVLARELFEAGTFPLFLGGEHSISIGVFRALKDVHGPVDIIQVDAHADLRDTYNGSELNHACVMSRARDEGHRLLQLGIRALSSREAGRIERVSEIECGYDHDPSWREDIADTVARFARSRKLYLTIDVDGIDPALMPATGTPVPGGLSWRELNDVVTAAAGTGRLVGADINELSPAPGHRHCDMACAQLAYRIISAQAAARDWPLQHPYIDEED